MKQKPIFISFSTQKGGVGKSTFTALAASYLHYECGYNVAVVDCDYPQCSLKELRRREVEQVKKNDYYRNKAIALCNWIDKQPYPIMSSKPEAAIETANEYLSKSNQSYDVVFFDMAGTINNGGMLVTYLSMDYIFTPMLPSRMVLESTFSFIDMVKELRKTYPNIAIKETYLFWNRIDGRVKRDTIEAYEKIISILGFKKLNTMIPQSVRFDKEQSALGTDAVFLSTIFPPDKLLLKGSNLDLLINEIIAVTELNTLKDTRNG